MNLTEQATRPDYEYIVRIPLTQGMEAIIDAADYELVSPYKWYARWHKDTSSFRAVSSISLDGKRRLLYMHRLILGLGFGDKREGDHINLDTLDNRRSHNLRISSRSQNACNRSTQANNKFGLKGVSSFRGGYRARIHIGGVQKHLGLFRTPEEAYSVYCKAASQFHGEFARTT